MTASAEKKIMIEGIFLLALGFILAIWLFRSSKRASEKAASASLGIIISLIGLLYILAEYLDSRRNPFSGIIIIAIGLTCLFGVNKFREWLTNYLFLKEENTRNLSKAASSPE